MRECPAAGSRRHRVAVLLEILVFAVLAARAAGRLGKDPRALHGAGLAPPPPLAVDLESDPPGRLELLPGIGPVRAARIARERAARGPFGSADGLERVPGIGPVTVRRILEAREVRPRFAPRDPGREDVQPSGR